MYNVSFPNGDEATFDILESGAWSITGKYASRTRSRLWIYSDAIGAGFTREYATQAIDHFSDIAQGGESWAGFVMEAIARSTKGVNFAHRGGPRWEDTIWNLSPMAVADSLGREAE